MNSTGAQVVVIVAQGSPRIAKDWAGRPDVSTAILREDGTWLVDDRKGSLLDVCQMIADYSGLRLEDVPAENPATFGEWRTAYICGSCDYFTTSMFKPDYCPKCGNELTYTNKVAVRKAYQPRRTLLQKLRLAPRKWSWQFWNRMASGSASGEAS